MKKQDKLTAMGDYMPLRQVYQQGPYKPESSEKDPYKPKAAITYAAEAALDKVSGPMDINLEDDKSLDKKVSKP